MYHNCENDKIHYTYVYNVVNFHDTPSTSIPQT